MISVNISRADVMSIVEGISVIASQHNPGVINFEALWASASEQKKLDIYYREAVGDLEQRLMDWVPQTHAQFILTNDGSNYTLTIKPARWWPTRLSGLLRNKIQDFIVHSIAAGWLATFSGLTVQDYAAMAAQDLTDAHVLLEQREFGFDDAARNGETVKPVSDDTPTSASRAGDTAKPVNDDTAEADTRNSDTVKPESTETPEAAERGGDTAKPENAETATAGQRGEDTSKPESTETPEAAERGEDTSKPENAETASAGQRGEDTDKADSAETPEAAERGDDEAKPENAETATAGIRGADISKGDGADTAQSGERSDDSFKTLTNTELKTSMRRKDNERKNVQSQVGVPQVSARNRDDAPVCITHDYTDWSGTDFGRLPDPNGVPTDMALRMPPHPGAEHRILPPCPPCKPPMPPTPPAPPAGQSDGRYWPRQDKPWYGTLEDMSHQEQEHRNAEYERKMEREHGPGPYMEKYRNLHDEEFMQEHTCGHDDCGAHGLKPLEW